MDISGKTVVVTGAGSGIGRATSVMFAREGARVVVGDVRRSAAEETAARIHAVGLEATPVDADVTRANEVEAMMKIADGLGPVCALVNAAGAIIMGEVASTSEDDWDRVLDINLKGTFLCCRSALQRMLRREEGVIINVSSAAATNHPVLYPSYAASKAGVVGFTASLAKQVRRNRIAVLTVSPSTYVDTPMGWQAFNEQMGHEPNKEERAAFLQPDDVASVIVGLFKTDTLHMSGSVIDVTST